MKILERRKVSPIHVEPDGTIHLLVNGQEVLRRKIERTMTIDEFIVFNLDSGDIEGIKDGIGGAFLESGVTTTHASPNKLP